MQLFNNYSFENWFFEFKHKDKIIGCSFVRANVYGVRFGSVRIDSKDLNINLYFTGKQIKTTKTGSDLYFPSGSLSEQENGSHIVLKNKGQDIDLLFKPVSEPYVPQGSGVLFEKKSFFSTRLLRWIVPSPICEVKGNFLGEDVNSIGYHEFFETNIPPWNSPISTIHKGRYYTESDALLAFFEVRFKQEMAKPPENFGFMASLKKGFQESERNMILREETKDGQIATGANIFSFNDREIRIKFKLDKKIYSINIDQIFCPRKSLIINLYKHFKSNQKMRKYKTKTKAGDKIIIGIHDLLI